MRLVECVPNFSEGRDMSIINQITAEIERTEGAKLLDVDPGADTNRTVVTFVATPESVLKAAFAAIKKASEVIDMRKHKGAHARMGATDVCPFVPIAGITANECIELAKQLGKRVADELKIPVYLYENAASSPERQNLANIRKGEYEGFSEKLKDPAWRPDFGEPVFNEKSGATVIGVREFLIAYNVDLNTTDKKIANQIALDIREIGRLIIDQKTRKIQRDQNGEPLHHPGNLKHCKAVGWLIKLYGKAQISINLTNYKVTPPHIAFEECRKFSQKYGVRVTGSEIVGLIPKEAMLMAGRYYLEKQGKTTGIPEKDIIHTAIISLGLNDVAPFEPEKKIIEYQFGQRTDALSDLKVNEFADELSRESAAPGGGSVAALAGSLGAGLASMVASLTHGKKGFENVWQQMIPLGEKAQALKDFYLKAIDEDTDAFNKVMDCFAMPNKTPEEKAKRSEAIQNATKNATIVPLSVLRRTKEILILAEEVAISGNQNSLSDAGVGAVMARACATGAYYNVLINLGSIKDKDFVEKTKSEADKLHAEALEYSEKIHKLVMKGLEEN
ncbi:glutamate formimidoyltransferase [bacterium]|nr:glutamate formimidoyltransferase [bacterium]